MLTAVIAAQADYDKGEAEARAVKSAKEVGKTKQLRNEISRTYDLFVRYTAAVAEAYPEIPLDQTPQRPQYDPRQQAPFSWYK